MSKANERQVDGNHYSQEDGLQHWDYVVAQNLDYFQGQITKYVTRWKKKNGLKDLQKAQHFLEKYIEVESLKLSKLPTGRKLPPKNTIEMAQPFGFDAGKEI